MRGKSWENREYAKRFSIIFYVYKNVVIARVCEHYSERKSAVLAREKTAGRESEREGEKKGEKFQRRKLLYPM